MGIIRFLDDHVANQIAAGEVVERPSSVVKELVENSIDAGATRIDVAVEEGGLKLIRVTDDGAGIEPEDMENAFCRHATSKIRDGRDLFRIRTLGFRGEALPSIAAVSRVECLSSADRTGLGRRLVMEGGKLVSHEPAAASRGTDMIVRDLFYNTPARLKYMKSVQTELGHISDYLYRLALARPDISFTLRHNGNTLLSTLGNGDLLQTFAAVYGTGTAKGMVRVENKSVDYSLQGLLSRPEVTRASRSGVSFFVNGRYIRNFALTNALLQAYHTLLPVNRYPLAALHLWMEPELIDVNVHPSKLEVRFSKEKELLLFITETAERALKGEVLIPKVTRPAGAVRQTVVQEKMPVYDPAPLPPDPEPPAASFGAASTASPFGADPGDRTGDRRIGGFSGRTEGRNLSDGQNFAPRQEHARRPVAFASSRRGEQPDPETIRGWLAADRPHPDGPRPEGPHAEPRAVLPELHPIGQMRGTYIIAQNEEGLYLIDQHAAHERINYERYLDLFSRPSPVSQELLLPITLEFTPAEAEVLRGRTALFEQAGVYLEPFGGNTFKVTSYPPWFPKGEEKQIIAEMAEWIISEKKAPDIGKLREQSAILCACRASVKANDSMTMAEIEHLLAQLRRTRNPFTCPHGRPVVVSFSNYELEKMFKRVM